MLRGRCTSFHHTGPLKEKGEKRKGKLNGRVGILKLIFVLERTGLGKGTRGLYAATKSRVSKSKPDDPRFRKTNSSWEPRPRHRFGDFRLYEKQGEHESRATQLLSGKSLNGKGAAGDLRAYCLPFDDNCEDPHSKSRREQYGRAKKVIRPWTALEKDNCDNENKRNKGGLFWDGLAGIRSKSSRKCKKIGEPPSGMRMD